MAQTGAENDREYRFEVLQDPVEVAQRERYDPYRDSAQPRDEFGRVTGVCDGIQGTGQPPLPEGIRSFAGGAATAPNEDLPDEDLPDETAEPLQLQIDTLRDHLQSAREANTRLSTLLQERSLIETDLRSEVAGLQRQRMKLQTQIQIYLGDLHAERHAVQTLQTTIFALFQKPEDEIVQDDEG